MSVPTAPTGTPTPPPRLPPRWFIVSAWAVHRALYRVTGGRKGLRRPRPGVYGMMRLHTIGRRTGEARVAIVASVEDGADVVTMAMNGWGEPPPAWWINLQANPEAMVDLPNGSRTVRASEASGTKLGAAQRSLLQNERSTPGGTGMRSVHFCTNRNCAQSARGDVAHFPSPGSRGMT